MGFSQLRRRLCALRGKNWRSEMKALIAVLGLAILVASPAMAQTAKRVNARAVAAPVVVGNGPQTVDSQSVVLDDNYIARDPDAQVRLELQRSGAFYQHGGY
jgi:hypothetical protein